MIAELEEAVKAAREGQQASHEEELESLQKQVRALQNDLEDSEYRHQMTSRQFRREKTQMEKVLQEKSQLLDEVKAKSEEVEKKLASFEENDKESLRLKDTIKTHEEKLENLDAVIVDLRSCLQSSKEAQSCLEEQLAKYKQKCRDLEDKVVAADDQMQSLQSQLCEVRTYTNL